MLICRTSWAASRAGSSHGTAFASLRAAALEAPSITALTRVILSASGTPTSTDSARIVRATQAVDQARCARQVLQQHGRPGLDAPRQRSWARRVVWSFRHALGRGPIGAHLLVVPPALLLDAWCAARQNRIDLAATRWTTALACRWMLVGSGSRCRVASPMATIAGMPYSRRPPRMCWSTSHPRQRSKPRGTRAAKLGHALSYLE